MKFLEALAAIVGAATVLASPTPIDLGDGVTLTPRKSGVERRRTNRPPIYSNGTKEHFVVEGVDSHIVYNENWAGAVLM